MPRPQRIEYIGAWYHVINQGIGKKKIFRTDKQREAFLRILDDVSITYGIVVHAYCLLDDSYHLLISTPDANLSTSMRHINSVYTQFYNKNSTNEGNIFKGRFKAVLVDKDNYGAPISRYIHNLPVQNQLAKKPQDYSWSSFAAYIGKKSPVQHLDASSVLNMISKRDGAKQYRKFMAEGLDPDIRHFYGKKNLRSVIGNPNFLKKSRQKLDQKKAGAEVKRPRKPKLTLIGKKTAEAFKVNYNSLFHTARGRGGNNIPRGITMLMCRQIGNYTLREIAEFFDIDDISTVSATVKRIKGMVSSNNDLKKRVEGLYGRLAKA